MDMDSLDVQNNSLMWYDNSTSHRSTFIRLMLAMMACRLFVRVSSQLSRPIRNLKMCPSQGRQSSDRCQVPDDLAVNFVPLASCPLLLSILKR